MRNFIKILPLFILFYSCSSGDIHFNKANSQFKNDLDESWIVINYWADWCPPCLKEMPELVNFAQSNPDIKVFTYPADHGFNCDHRKQFCKTSTKVALDRTLKFLKINL